jgi:MFS family permease
MRGVVEPTETARVTLAEGRVSLGSLVAYWLGLNVLWGSVTTIILPRLVETLVPAAIKTTALALVAGLQAIVSIIVQPVAGAASDRLTSPWGRRRPLIVVGVTVQVLLLLLLLRVSTFGALVVTMLCVEVASNLAQGPYQGLLPDLIPRGDRGVASGLMGGAQLAGQVVGAAGAGLAVAAGDLPLAIVLSAAAVGIGAFATVSGVEETEGRSEGRTGRWRLPRPAELGRLPAWGRALRTMVLEVWGRDVLEHRDYLWLLASRLAILMATGTLQPFVYYLLEDSLGMGSAAAVAVAPLAGLVAVIALVSAVPGGAMTGRWGRVRTVQVSALTGAAGAALFCFAPTYASLFIIAIPFGLALGIFLAADWALLTDVAPQDEAGRYLGLSNTVTAGAGLLAVALGGPLADAVNRWQFGAGYRAIFLLAAVEFVIGAWCIRHVHEPASEAAA